MMMLNLLARAWLLSLPTTAVVVASVISSEDDDISSLRVGGYLPDYRFDSYDLEASSPFLTDLLLFSVQPVPSLGKDMLTSCCLQSKHFEAGKRARDLKKEQGEGKSLTLWLTVGGGGRSDEFLSSDLDTLTESLKSMAAQYDIDGIDIDCETFKHRKDYERYANWIREATKSFHEVGLLVSVALHPGQFLPLDVYASIDRVHLMTYNMHGIYHADPRAMEEAVKHLIQSGCPSDIIMLGIPAYSMNAEKPTEVRTYAELVDAALEKDGTIADLDKFGEFDGFRGETPFFVRDKMKYAKHAKLAGIVFWELGQDKQNDQAKGGILLEASSGKVYEESKVLISDEL